MTLYPMRFDPIYKPKVWGGRRLERRFARALPGADPIGESWELADLAATDPSGGGGEAAESRVGDGPLRGKTLAELIQRFGRDLVGGLPLNECGRFPLLFKYLDAHEHLSVQVHPSAAYAARHPEAHLKSEAWYIVDAEPGAAIYKGVDRSLTPEALREAIAGGGVERLLRRVPARPGDCHYLPSGTIHALGAGILVAEVQTASDTTFRVFDWGRGGRELHVEQALACADLTPTDVARHELATRFERDGLRCRALAVCEHFRIEEFSADAGSAMPLVLNGRPAVWMVIEGAGSLSGPGPSTPLAPGHTLLLPASLEGWSLHTQTPTRWLHVTFPAAGADVMA